MQIIAGVVASAYKIAGSFESIATTTVGSGGAADITFSSIPATYKHLQIRGIIRNNNSNVNDAEGLLVQYNSDTAANYSWHRLEGNGTSASSASGASASYMYTGYSPTSGSTASTFAAVVIDVLDYADTNKYKTQRSLNGMDTNVSTNGYILFTSGSWRSTSAISSIKLYTTTSRNFLQYSSFALYGIKGA
jgi:hypothetical protein